MKSNTILNMQTILEDAAQRLGSHHPENLSWYAFPQTWSSTALGFGGIGGAAMTTAQTVVVITHDYSCGSAAVYFSGHFAYVIENCGEEFANALLNRRMPSVREHKKLERQLLK